VLSQFIERPVSDGGAEIATVQISLVRPVTEATAPPRALWVPFNFGRPLGPPGRPDIQLEVLRSTLALVDQASGPALIDYNGEEGDDSVEDEAWSCPVTFPAPAPESEADALTAQLQQEAQLLRPWFDEGLRTRGRTSVGTSGKGADSVDEMLRVLARFAVDGEMAVPDGFSHPMPQLLRFITDDVRDFYNEAAISKPGSKFPTPQELLDWFFLETVAGEVFYQVREKLLAADMLVLTAKGLEDDEIDVRLSLAKGTTAAKSVGLLKSPGVKRELLQKSAEVFQANQPNRLSWTIVPIAMRDCRDERVAARAEAGKG
tara:strand:- start:1855 stop:2805 length:951 start_codon:yes stop_codon:yes gene_type:complete